MSLFNERQLYLLVRNKKWFDLFVLSERERLVIKMRVNGFPYEHIGTLAGRVSPARARQIYNTGLKKMREQLLEALKKAAEKQEVAVKTIAPTCSKIAGMGVAWYGGAENAPAHLSVLMVGREKVG